MMHILPLFLFIYIARGLQTIKKINNLPEIYQELTPNFDNRYLYNISVKRENIWLPDDNDKIHEEYDYESRVIYLKSSNKKIREEEKNEYNDIFIEEWNNTSIQNLSKIKTADDMQHTFFRNALMSFSHTSVSMREPWSYTINYYTTNWKLDYDITLKFVTANRLEGTVKILYSTNNTQFLGDGLIILVIDVVSGLETSCETKVIYNKSSIDQTLSIFSVNSMSTLKAVFTKFYNKDEL